MQNGQIAVVNTLPANALIFALDNAGQVVGGIQDTSTARRYAYLYDLNRQQLVDLDATVGKSVGWTLESAIAINDQGQIIGNGQHNGEPRNYLLTPL